MVLCVHGLHRTGKALAKTKKIFHETAAHILEPSNCFIDVPRGKLVQFFVMPKDNHCDIDRAQNGKLMSLLEKPTFAFEKSPMSAVLANRPRRRNFYSIVVFFFGLIELSKVWRRLGDAKRVTYTERFLSSLIALISIFLLPMVNCTDLIRMRKGFTPVGCRKFNLEALGSG